MNRREFFKEVSTSALDNPAAHQDTPRAYQTMETAGSPRQYSAGAFVLIASARAFLCRDELGFYAIDAHCTHLGCLVRPTEAGFLCPCHHSRFQTTGETTAGPAARGLRYLYVDLDEQGNLVISRERTTHPNDRFIA